MSNIINADNGVVSGIAGVKLSSDSTGVLDIQTNGTTAITISTAQVVSLTNSPTFTGGTANGVLYLNASKVATSGSALTFDGTNLGVGTASPAFKLDINGVAAVRAGNAIRYYRTDNAIYTQLYDAGSSGFTLDNTNGDGFRFQSASTNQMVLNSSGNLGLGVTPNVWLSSFRAIQLGQGSSLWGAATGNNAGFDSNAYVNTSGSSIYVGSTFATRYQQNDGKHMWYTAASGTAGNTITFTQAMTLTAAGEFLINTTTTTGNGKFTNSNESASLAGASTARIWNQIKNVAASNNATVDVWLGRDAAGNVIGNNFLVGHFNLFVIGASGVNSFAGVYSIVTTGNGTSPATLSAVSTVTRGTSPVSSVQIAADGAGGAIKLTITYINNAGVVTGGNSQVSFIGQIN